MKIGHEAEIRHESQLAGRVVTSAAKGKGGVIDLDDTLNAVREGRVQLLLIRDGFREPGRRCQGCGYLSTKPLDACPYCGSDFEPITDAVELAVRNVIRSGGEVEVMHKDQVVSGFDQIGALLRY
jgi:peptide subunit release factor 1 (eRF1)